MCELCGSSLAVVVQQWHRQFSIVNSVLCMNQTKKSYDRGSNQSRYIGKSLANLFFYIKNVLCEAYLECVLTLVFNNLQNLSNLKYFVKSIS